jgi:hypothetical protein
MEPDPDINEFIDELMRVCEGLIQDLIDEGREDIVCNVYFVREKTICPYDDVDDLAASIAFSKLPSID